MRSLDSCLDEVQPRKGDFYVYVLHRPCGEPFYVGCGKVRPRGRRNQRIAFHEEDAKSASTSHKCNVIRKIWADGGSVGYSIAAWLSSEPEMFAKEIELIALLGRSDKGLGPLTNWSDGGDGIVNRSAEVLAKASRSMKAKVDAAFRARQSETVKRSWSNPESVARRMAAIASPETKARQSEVNTRNNARPDVKELKRKAGHALWADPDYLVRQRSAHLASITDEVKAKLSATSKSRWSDPEYRERLRASHRARWQLKKSK